MAAATLSGADALKMNSLLTCPICCSQFNSFNLPLALSECGHTYCLKCINNKLKTDKRSGMVTCPDCHQISDSKKVKKNATLLAASQFQMATKIVGCDSVIDGPCLHVDFIESPIKCNHCSERFCDVCFCRHNEHLKMEILWADSGLEEKRKKLLGGSKFDDFMAEAEESIWPQVKKIENEVDEKMGDVERAFKAVMEKCRQRNKSSLLQIANEQISIIKTMAASIRQGNTDEENEQMKSLAEVSTITCEEQDDDDDNENAANKIAYSYQRILRKQHEISNLILIKENGFDMRIGYDAGGCSVAKSLIPLLETFRLDFSFTMFEHPFYSDKKIVDEVAHLYFVIFLGNLPAVKEILLRPELPENCRRFAAECRAAKSHVLTSRGDTPLTFAAAQGHLPIVRFLVEEMKVHQETDPDGVYLQRAIEVASDRNRVDVAEFLCHFVQQSRNSSEPSQTQPKKRLRLLNQSKEKKNGETTRIMPFSLQTAIQRALVGANVKLAQLLLSFGNEHAFFDVNAVIEPSICCSYGAGSTLLRHALNRDKPKSELVEFLVNELGADVNLAQNGVLPIHLAVEFGSLKIVKFLVEKGADLNATVMNNGKDLPVHLATARGRASIVAYLLELSSKHYDAVGSDSLTPLQMARRWRHPATVRAVVTMFKSDDRNKLRFK